MPTKPINEIKIPKGRALRGDVAALADSIKELGLLNPITVAEDGTLVAGFHRLEAVKSLGWKEVQVKVMKLDTLHAKLATIDENLCHAKLSAIDRAAAIAERKTIYEALHPETKHGKAPAKKGGKGGKAPKGKDAARDSFTSDTAKKSRRSRRSVSNSARIGEKIDPKAAEILADTEVANSSRQLTALVALAPAEQVEIAKAIASGEAKTVAEAIAARAPEDEAPKDEAGREIPKHLRGIFELRDDFAAIGSALTQVKSKIKALSELKELREAVPLTYIATRLDEARSRFLIVQPHAVCPYCVGGKGQGECSGCRSLGWVDRSTFDAAPAEKRKAG